MSKGLSKTGCHLQRQRHGGQAFCICTGILTDLQDDPSQVSVPLAIEDLRFRFREKNLLAESNCSNLQRASSTNINDIENGTYNGPPLGQSTDISEDSRSTAASISRSTAMHRMVDSLVAPEASENVERNLNSLQSFQRGPSPGSAVGGSENGPFSSLPSFPKATNSPQVDSPAHIPPALPNIWDSPFTPRPGEAGSVLTISSPSHNFPANATAHTPIAQSSNTTFREALQRQQQELEMQQSSMYDLPTSLSRPASSVPNAMFLGRHSSPIPSPFSGSPSIPSATFPASEVQRSASQLARFGAVGQTPPSGQGG